MIAPVPAFSVNAWVPLIVPAIEITPLAADVLMFIKAPNVIATLFVIEKELDTILPPPKVRVPPVAEETSTAPSAVVLPSGDDNVIGPVPAFKVKFLPATEPLIVPPRVIAPFTADVAITLLAFKTIGTLLGLKTAPAVMFPPMLIELVPAVEAMVRVFSRVVPPTTPVKVMAPVLPEFNVRFCVPFTVPVKVIAAPPVLPPTVVSKLIEAPNVTDPVNAMGCPCVVIPAFKEIAPIFVEPATRAIERPAGIATALVTVMELFAFLCAQSVTFAAAAWIVAGEMLTLPDVEQLGAWTEASVPPPPVMMMIDAGSKSQSPYLPFGAEASTWPTSMAKSFFPDVSTKPPLPLSLPPREKIFPSNTVFSSAQRITLPPSPFV